MILYTLGDNRFYWIGAYEPRDGEGWFWNSTNANLNEGYTNWATNYNTGPDEKCLARKKTTRWFDYFCDGDQHVLCEYPEN